MTILICVSIASWVYWLCLLSATSMVIVYDEDSVRDLELIFKVLVVHRALRDECVQKRLGDLLGGRKVFLRPRVVLHEVDLERGPRRPRAAEFGERQRRVKHQRAAGTRSNQGLASEFP